MIFCITIYYVVLRITIHMQLMAAMRYFDRLESETSPDQFEDFCRKLVLALAPRFGESLRTSASDAALLDEALQVGRHLLHIISHYLRVFTVDFGIIYMLSRCSRLNQMGWMPSCPSLSG